MKAFFKTLLLLFTFSIYPLYGDCTVSLQGQIMDLGGSEGIDSIQIVGNKAYVSLNYESSNLDYPVEGFGAIDISDPSSYMTYQANQDSLYDYNATKYLGDVSNFVKLYIYGKDFSFSGDALGNFPHFELTKAVQEGDKIALYGYTNSKSAVYVWKITLLNSAINSMVYKKYDNFNIYSSTSDDKGDYFLLLPKTDNAQKIYDILFAPYGDNYATSVQIVKSDTITTDLNTYPSPSITSNADFVFAHINNGLLKIDKSSHQVDDISDRFANNEVGLLLYATCSHLFYSSNFDKLVIKNLDTNESSKIRVWDPSRGTLIKDTFFLANMGAMVNIIDVSDPMNPVIESNTSEWGHTDEVVYKDGKIYVGLGWGGMAVYDVSGCVTDTSGLINNCADSGGSDNDNNNDTNQSSGDNGDCCFTAQDVEALPAGWSLVGTGCDINDTSIFSNVKTVWKYNSQTKRWEAYSPDSNTRDIINNHSDIDMLNFIGSKKGFWILK